MKQDDMIDSFLNKIDDDLDITNSGEYNLDTLQEALQVSQQDELIRAVLAQGTDINEYSKAVQDELSQIEWGAIGDYIQQSSELADLHSKIRASDKLLQDMGSILTVFESDLLAVSADIETLQQHSRNLAQQLSNRRAVRDAVANTIGRLVIPPELIVGLSGDVNEGYVKFVTELDAKLHGVYDLNAEDVAAAADLFSTLDSLRLMTVRKLRDFVLSQVYSLRKPKTNIQIKQHNVLIKYAAFNKFLFVHSPVFAVEIRDHYIETVSRTFANYFGNYISGLSKLQVQLGTISDLLGKDEAPPAKKLFGGSKKPKKATTKTSGTWQSSDFHTSGTENHTASPHRSSTNLAGSVNQFDPTTHSPTHVSRSAILLSLDSAPAIIPHVAMQAGVKYSYESLYRSMQRLLIDTISSEHLFVLEWFPKQMLHGSQASACPDQLFVPIFGKCLGLLQDNLATFLGQCFDPIGVLLLVKITQHSLTTMEFRNIQLPPLTAYLQHTIGILWERFNKLLEMNVESVRAAAAKYPTGPRDTRPNSVVRKYSAFLASLLTINNTTIDAQPPSPQLRPFSSPAMRTQPLVSSPQPQPAGDQRVTAWLTVLRTAVERLLDHISAPLDPRLRPVFLINNFDLIISVLRERGVDTEKHGDDGARFQYNLKVETAVFVEEELHNFYPRLIDFVKVCDSKLLKDPNFTIDKEIVESLSLEFAGNWKKVLEQINTDVMSYFTNFELGTDILKKVLSQLVLYYKRFEEIHRKCFRASSNPAQNGNTNTNNNNNNDDNNSSTSNNNNTNSNSASSSTPPSTNAKGRSLVPLSTITYLITNKYSTFS